MEQGETPPAAGIASPTRSDSLRRFDEVFRTLLVIGSVLISGQIAFSKGLLPLDIFAYNINAFVLTISAWSIGTLVGRDVEVVFKIVAWYFLMLTLLGTIGRLILYSTYILPNGSLVLISIGGFLLSYPMLNYLGDLVSSRAKRNLRIVIVAVTIIFIIADVISSLFIPQTAA